MDKKQLLVLKDEIDEAKTIVAELTGQKKSQMTQLKETFGCSSLEEAEKKVKKMTDEIDSLDEKITNGMEKLEEMYNE